MITGQKEGIMEVKLAECAGFCFGVKRAVDTVYEQVNTGKTIYTYGPIVHNEEVVRELEEMGVKVLENKEELLALKCCGNDGKALADAEPDCTVIIRAHGVPREIYDIIADKGLECVDATCPFVKRIHKIVNKAGEDGKHVVIVGNPGHPEVEGIKGWCSGPVTILETVEEAEK